MVDKGHMEQKQSLNHLVPIQEEAWQGNLSASDDKKLELSLGPPGERNWPVVGWPPVRSSFRKNLASGSGTNPKPVSDNSPYTIGKEGNGSKKPGSISRDLLVKINMEGVPIGRKINLNAYDSYEQLSVGIHELFSGLLAAQRGSLETQNEKDKMGETESYTLVYEDNEGDRILVGDVPWHMFVSTAKRLRVLKSSELPRSD